MNVSINTFGQLPNGEEAKIFRFESSEGLTICITNYGGIITSIKTPDRVGNIEEISAGFSSLDQYLNGHPFFGTIVGRFANRIAKGHFNIDGNSYNLPINNSPNHLHGGDNGFHTKLWDFEIKEADGLAKLKLTYSSPHLEEGYPGNLKATVTYTVFDNNSVDIEFSAQADAPTHVNLTSHGYFNLGAFKDKIYDHQLFVNADQYLEIDDTQIPTGKFATCKGSHFDFSQTKELKDSVLSIPGGLDHCYVLRNGKGFEIPAAELIHKASGRKLSVYCTNPGIQVYSGNSLDGSITGHNATVYHKHMAICLEMQHFPDTPNQNHFPSTRLNPGEMYYQKARLVFSIE
ncbi:MAG: aldose epimerase family protein [Tenuifilaceae bacterium]|jgi:aldose 1-epimerase|nr:aldose epimerase family protein [Tenuifilaceae bacterium]